MKSYLVLILCFFTLYSFSQNNIHYTSGDKLQYGVSTKLQIEFQIKQKPNLRLSLSGGVGYNIGNAFFPSLHTGILVFNKGVIGSNLKDHWTKLRLHFFYNALGTIKLDQRDYSFAKRYVPLYHFSDFTANPLQNPYKSSVSFGAVWLHLSEKKKQRLGFFNSNIVGRAQISYYNDGGPILKWLGDKRDRYYTGGIVFSYHGDDKSAIDLVELSYHKYTGYVAHAFDVGEKLQLDFQVYADKSQFAYNHQRWKLNVANISDGISGHISLYDNNGLDVQDFLHFKTNVPYHPDYYQNSYRWALGGRYEFNYLRLTE